jgi:hypothetical protein
MSLRVRPTVLALIVAAIAAAGCNTRLFGNAYEYEEDLYLSLDGSAELVVNSSIAALVALRGLDLDMTTTRVDRERVRAAYESPVTSVTRVSRPWVRRGRRFVQIRVKVADVRRLSEAKPFSWSHYELTRHDGQHVFRHTVGSSALRAGTLRKVGWDGSERVAFRLHLPSHIRYHNVRDLETDQPGDVQRGNILVWEQHLADRLEGQPLVMEVRMDSQSILYRTLWLFAGAFLGAVALIGILIWMAMRRGVDEPATTP